MASKLICARADAPLVVPGSVFDRRCQQCGASVMIGPSGQEVLRAYPNSEIVCEFCYTPGPGDRFSLPGPVERVLREVKSAIENPLGRGRRN